MTVSAADDEGYLRYTHPTIREPFPDLLNLDVPVELAGTRLAVLGYVDVTQAPFGADLTGRRDSTVAIQAAVNFARDHQMACFFPSGTYLLSDTLECTQQLYRRSNGRVFGGNRFPVMLVGSRRTAERPRLVLAPRSPGFDDPAHPKTFIHFWSRGYRNPTNTGRVGDGMPPDQEQPNIGMNQMMENLAIVIGEGNSGAVAVRHQAAEGSAIEDCLIDATHGFTGLQGGIGSGGSSTGVTIIGGRIGLDLTGYLSGTQPTPVITGFTFRGQTETVIRSTSRQTLVAVGLKIIADRCAGPLIHVPAGQPANHGELTLVDSEIEFTGEALTRAKRVVVDSDCGTYLDNVFVRGATTIVEDRLTPSNLSDDSGDWLHVRQYAAASSSRGDQGLTYRYPVYRDGREVGLVRTLEPGLPPSNLQARHLWGETCPSFESAGAVSVMDAPYGAKGDGRADDAAAIQRAIDENEVVFLPKGCFLLGHTIKLKPHTKLIGVGQTFSLLVPTPELARSSLPLVSTADTAAADTVLAFLGFAEGGARDGATTFLVWRSGGRSVFRGVEIKGGRAGNRFPVVIMGHGGGNFYNLRDSSARLLIEGTSGPLRFYQFSVQQVTSEVRGARNVDYFGTKYEGNDPMLVFKDCDQVRLFGHGGNAKARVDASLFVFERTTNFLFANAVDGPTKIGSMTLNGVQGSTDPRRWHMLIDRPADAPECKLPPLDRPVLYQRGTPSGS